MAEFNPTILSDMAIHPGEFLRDELEARGMTPAQLAERAGLPLQLIDDIVSERDVIREDIADNIGACLGDFRAVLGERDDALLHGAGAERGARGRSRFGCLLGPVRTQPQNGVVLSSNSVMSAFAAMTQSQPTQRSCDGSRSQCEPALAEAVAGTPCSSFPRRRESILHVCSGLDSRLRGNDENEATRARVQGSGSGDSALGSTGWWALR